MDFFLVFRKILFKKNEFSHLKSLIGMKTPPKTPLLNKPETPLGNFKTPLGGANTPVQETLYYMMKKIRYTFKKFGCIIMIV